MNRELDDDELKLLLSNARRIAVVGLSPDPSRPSHQVARYLIDHGYLVFPVNPNCTEVLGLPCYPELHAVPEQIDIVDVFRRSDQVAPVADEAIEVGAGALWLQLGVVDERAAQRARVAGMRVVMDHCIKIEHHRLGIGVPPTDAPGL